MSFGDAVAAAINRSSRKPAAAADESDDGLSRSSASTEATAGSLQTESAPGPRHEGWLYKRTSARITGRWQRRYFSLEGFILRYHHDPSGPPKRTFDIRKVRRIGLAAGQRRELELDFGFRVWRLRAETDEAARRWQLLLDTGRLLAGIPENAIPQEFEERWSDDDTGSSCSTCETVGSKPERGPGTPNFASRSSTSQGPTAWGKASSPPVDLAALDRQFEVWLSQGHHAPEGKQLVDGLAQALAGLRADLRAGGQTRGGGASVAGFSEPSWSFSSQISRPATFRVITEYFQRIRCRLQQWFQEDDPDTEEVSLVIRWFLYHARPELERHEAAWAQLGSEGMQQCHDEADGIEKLLLGQWESRRCDEVAERCEAAYADSGLSQEPKSIQILEEMVQQAVSWQDHAAASDRATSVLIMALNGLLRCFRRAAWPQQQAETGSVHSGTKERLGKALRKLGQRALSRSRSGPSRQSVPSREEIMGAATEAAKVSQFCSEATIMVSMSSATAHFQCRGISYRSLHPWKEGILGSSCSAADRFLTEIPDTPPLCRQLAGRAVLELMAKHWARKLQAAPPLFSRLDFPKAVRADEELLLQFARRWGNADVWSASPLRMALKAEVSCCN